MHSGYICTGEAFRKKHKIKFLWGINKMQNAGKNITRFSLTWPLFFEFILRMLLSNVNVLMLSGYSDKAVAAVGVCAQIMNMILTLFMVTSTGSGIIISQYLGAGDGQTAAKAANLSIIANMLIGAFMSIILVVFSRRLLILMNLSGDILDYGSQYLYIVGGSLILQALITTISVIARNFGKPKFALCVAFIINILNLAGNYIALYKPFGLPSYGIEGVAVSLLGSTLIGVLLMLWFLYKRLNLSLSFKELIPFPVKIFNQILKIGVPSAMENILFTATQTVAITIVTLIGAVEMAAMIYIQSIIPFVYLLSVSMGMATQIMVGHLVGAGKRDEADKESLKSLKYGIISNTLTSLLLMLLRIPILSLYTEDIAIIKIAAFILIIDIGVEIGRSFNNILAWSLRGVGDARYTMKMAIISMGIIDIPMCYILGVWLKMGIVGIWIAFALDEWYRGIMFYKRWKSKKWKQMCLVSLVEHQVEI